MQEYYYDLWNIFNHKFELNIKDEELKKLVSDSISHGNNETAEEILYSQLEYKYKATNSSHLRIDYDAKTESHHKCEIQIGSINNIRIPMALLISPFLFFEFIFKNLFKNEFEVIRKKQGYSATFSNAKKNSFDIIPFIEENIFGRHNY